MAAPLPSNPGFLLTMSLMLPINDRRAIGLLYNLLPRSLIFLPVEGQANLLGTLINGIPVPDSRCRLPNAANSGDKSKSQVEAKG
jgi:hypothetical protein